MENSILSGEANSSENNEVSRLSSLKAILEAAGVDYTIISHRQTYVSAQDGAESGLGTLDEMAPTFILSTESGYISAIVLGDTRLLYKKIKQQLGLKNVSLATPDKVKEITGAEIGEVALVNPGLKTIIDERVTQKKAIYGGCGVPNHTLRINPGELISICRAQVFDFAELKVKQR